MGHHVFLMPPFNPFGPIASRVCACYKWAPFEARAVGVCGVTNDEDI